MAADLVFLIDVDNTLLDNDAVVGDFKRHLTAAFGPEGERRYWDIFQRMFDEIGYADYLGALQRYRVEHPHNLQALRVSLFLLHYPFAERLYPRALGVIEELRRRAPVVILTDGDAAYQPNKVERSGLWQAVDGVLIYVHKEAMLEDIERQFPARHYVMVDDKLRILSAMKAIWGQRMTTVFAKQGHYAYDSSIVDAHPPADLSIDRIGDLPGAVLR